MCNEGREERVQCSLALHHITLGQTMLTGAWPSCSMRSALAWCSHTCGCGRGGGASGRGCLLWFMWLSAVGGCDGRRRQLRAVRDGQHICAISLDKRAVWLGVQGMRWRSMRWAAHVRRQHTMHAPHLWPSARSACSGSAAFNLALPRLHKENGGSRHVSMHVGMQCGVRQGAGAEAVPDIDVLSD